MKLTKKLEAEVTKVYDTWLNSYLNGDVKTYDSYLDKDYHFIGSTDNEDFLTRKETTKFFKTTAEQLAGKCQIKNNIRIIEKFDELVFITERFDANFLIDKKWVYYGKFRFSSVMHKKTEGWRFIYQHFSLPDSKAQDGETLGAEQVSKENQELRDAIKRRTAELEIKNRELEIETSLEKVRAVAMGMHKQEDLTAIGKTIFTELKALGFSGIRNTEMVINNDEKETIKSYHYSDYGKQEVIEIGYKENPIVKKWAKDLKKAKNAFVPVTIPQKEIKSWNKYRKELGYKTDPKMARAKTVHYYSYSIGLGALSISCWQKLEDEQIKTLERFRNVFNLSYQRYTDIAKAEAQTREAQIEASLERVRSRSLAMHNTSELQDVIHTVHKEFLNLNIAIEGGSFITINSDIKTTLRCWGSGGTADTTEEIHIPLYKKLFCTNLINRIKKGPGFFTEAYTQKEKKDFFTFLFKHEPWKQLKAKEKKETLSSPGGYTRSCCVSKHTSIFIINNLGEIFSSADNDILLRFGKVFEQSYTRFLDLQKAEAQAREAEIELALERVRARTMAMQHSDELQEASFLLDEQVRALGIKTWGSAFNIYREKDSIEWFGNEKGVLPTYTIPRKGIFKKYYDQGQKGNTIHVQEFTGKKCIAHYEYMSTLPVIGDVLKQLKKTNGSFPDYQIDHVVYFKYGYLLFITIEQVPEAHEIFKRFVKVFEQTYTRFLDLQKAEASAREAQIEAAVERVRAEAMAMHSTSDFEKVVKQLLQQIQHLNLEGFTGAQIILIDENEFLTTWDCSSPGNISDPKSQTIRYEAKRFPILGLEVLNKWKEGQPYFVLDFDLKKLRAAVLEWEKIDVSIAKTIKKAISTGQLTHQWDACGRLYNGMIAFDMIKPPDDDVRNITIKMTHAFEQAYIRFLDLQKAEASAREAQIEAALEKVRSRSLAMYSSDELLEASDVMLAELEKLKINALRIGICTMDANTGASEIWTRFESQDNKGSKILGVVPKGVHHVFDDMVKSWLNKETYFTNTRTGKEVVEYYKKLVPFLPYPLPKTFNESETISCFFFLEGSINVLSIESLNNDECRIVLRFAKVFEQTYTRFLDLQKAEAQAREAQIEAALEKVRSRSLAMHQSNELNEVVSILFEKIKELQIPATAVGIATKIEGSKDLNAFVCGENENGLVITNYRLYYFKNKISNDIYNVFEKQLDFFVGRYSKKEKDGFYKYLLEHTAEFKDLPEDILQMIFESQSYIITMLAVKNAVFNINDFEGKVLAEKDVDIIKRFAKVFDQAYTRFLDLQKSEEQAKEATIEMALEKVRSRSMGMQKSEELKEVIQVVYDEFVKLKINVEHTGFIIDYKTNDDMHIWLADRHKVPAEISIPYFDSPHWNSFVDAKENGKDFFANHLSFEEKNKFYTDLFELIPGLPEEIKEYYLGYEALAISTVLIDNVGLYIENFTGTVYTDEENKILMRFGKVFQQTYTRFLDLQRAEEQAREGQIELGLERVRARAMAMQDTDELKEVIRTVYAELTKLNLSLDRCLIWTMNGEDHSTKLWMAGAEGIPVSFYVPYHEHPPYLSFVKGWKERNTKWEFDLGGKIKKDWDKFVFANTEMKYLPEPVKKGMQATERIIMAGSFQKFGCLQTAGPAPLTEKQYEVLNRFAKVFDSTYTRFNDLQKAEASAREAQIEAALERVRSRSMAMHKSDEMLEVVEVVSEQLQLLNLNFDTVSFAKNKQEGDFTFWFTSKGQPKPLIMEVPTSGSRVLSSVYEAKNNGTDFLADVFTAEENREWTEHLIKHSDLKYFPDSIKEFILNAPGFARSSFLLKNIGLYLGNYRAVPFTDQENAVFQKFALVFEQSYTRFIDLQKAEASAREAMIEASLERVRSRSMAMHKSDELREAGDLLCNEIKNLGIETITSGYVIMDDEENIGWNYAPNPSTGKIMEVAVGVPHNATAIMRSVKAAWKKQEPVFVVEMDQQETITHQTFIAEQSINFPINAEQLIAVSPPKLKLHNFNFKEGYLIIVGGTRLTDEQEGMMLRFTKVFQQTYRRFLDLQRAEAQAREAQIEAALEKVRSRSLAMHKPDELQEVIAVVAEKLTELGVIFDAGGVILCTYFPDNKDVVHWIVTPDFSSSGRYLLPYFDNPIFSEAWESKIRGDAYFSKEFPVEAKNHFFEYAFEHSDYKHMPKDYKEFVLKADQHRISAAWSKNSAILIPSLTGAVPSKSDAEIMKRFAKVFEQAYIRFMDLQKAEASAREAQIEAALERVRSQSMGMQTSKDLSNVTTAMFEQLRMLGGDLFATGIVFCDKHEGHVEQWHSLPDAGMISPFIVPVNLDYIHQYRYDQWKQGTELFSIEIPGDFIEQHFNDIFSLPSAQIVIKEFEANNTPMPATPPWEIDYGASFKHGYILASALQPFAEANILPRFAKVFEQTYIRFLDLKKAEAQAREAKIEMALEKIRSRTMAMQHSDELPEAANLLFLEVQALGIPAWSAGYNILADDKKSSHCIMSSEGEMQIPFNLPLTEHSSLIPWYEAIKNDLPFFVYEQDGEELVEHYRYMATLPELEPTLKQFADAGIALPTHQINHLVQFPNGFLLFITYEQVPEAHDIFKRFTKVFEQTYTRFLDLKKSEAQTRQAQIEVALERVRARALAMQQPEELKEVAEVLRQEMGLLGVEELETCSIYINDENAEKAECWYALKDLRSEEKKLVNDHFALNLNDTWVGREMLSFYNSEEKQISILMAGANRVEWIRFCEVNSAPFRGYYGDEIPDRTYHLYKFSHGAIGAASAGDISKESWGLLRRAASVFSLAYSRFKDLTQARLDLQRLKEEKQRAEEALSNLQAAQKQLVQSEKMASLGELTAGIAHEIQNPLNFVNNFSEVSKELLDEMKEEMDKGNLDDVRDIMKDVIQNLEKINHHGKRADGIVKGMLQHSRSSSGTKEPTDINALADEYLRLAYHGLRAKDKSFNAIMKTDFDASLEKINVIPQDIGRVILNLITNAFYVVNEKKQQIKEGYEPTVTISTKQLNGKVHISVQDNGKGMPDAIKEKIFQPFFTTKPTGQGTGLGLSLAFDIVTKGHGGELKVETKEGEGTEFIILFPV